MACQRPDDKPLSEPVMIRLLTHICVTRPQWVKAIDILYHILFALLHDYSSGWLAYDYLICELQSLHQIWSTAYAECSKAKTVNGHSYSRTVCVHILSVQAIAMVLMDLVEANVPVFISGGHSVDKDSATPEIINWTHVIARHTILSITMEPIWR